jgi:probable HAF family extracellular repeat protein
VSAALLAAVLIRMLPLPHNASIDPFGDRALMATSRDGQIAATLTIGGFAKRAILWRSDGSYRLFEAPSSVAGFDSSNSLLLNAGRPTRVWRDSPADAIDTSTCESFPQLSSGPVLAGALRNGAVIATMLSPPVVDLDDTSGSRAPVALYLWSGHCYNMGNGIALGTDGLYTAGYVGYIANVPAPSNAVSEKERFVATRWLVRTGEALGNGVALAVNAGGTTVGADAPPGDLAYEFSPHALLWRPGHDALEVAPGSALSVAYAVDENGRVAGMLEDAQGRHYAFLWENGRLRRIDDEVGSSDWRFECAYAFTPDGGIVGIGRYRGRPSVFVLKGIT